MTLDGLEAAVKAVTPYRSKVNVIRYADDFVITGKTKELLEETIKPAVERFLTERGLSLSPEKTRITRIEDGFDFLGQHPRKYSGKFLTKPARSNYRTILTRIRETIRKFSAMKAGDMVRALNPIIRGWSNYHRNIAAKSHLCSTGQPNLPLPAGLGTEKTSAQGQTLADAEVLAQHPGRHVLLRD